MYIIISTESILIAQGKCLGGVGAIMWACRARDSGSNPGQGASLFKLRDSQINFICNQGP